MNKFIIPILGIILLLVALIMAAISPTNYWLYMIIGGISIGILVGGFLVERARKRLGI